MPKYEAQHMLMSPGVTIKQGEVVTPEQLTNNKEDHDNWDVDRLVRIGALTPLKGTEGYIEPYVRPDQGTDPHPRGAVAYPIPPVTEAEIEAQIAALMQQKELVKAQQAQAEERAKANEVEPPLKRGPGRPASVPVVTE